MKTSVMLPDEVWLAAKHRAALERKALGEVIVDALRVHLAMPVKKERKKKGASDGKKG